MYRYPNCLCHYGVLGMKWGQRRARKAISESGRALKKASHYQEKNKKYLQVAKDQKAAGKSNVRALRKAKKARSDRDYWNSESKYQKTRSKNITEGTIRKSGGKTTYDRLSKMSTAKAVGQSIALGSYGALKYNQYRAADVSKGRSVVKALTYQFIDNMTLGGQSSGEAFGNRIANKDFAKEISKSKRPKK